jgi:hypothetical protein
MPNMPLAVSQLDVEWMGITYEVVSAHIVNCVDI